MIEYLFGLASALLPLTGLVVWLDRRDAARRRVQLRVDQMPQPLPGAYQRPPERVLAMPHPHVVVDGDVLDRED